MKTKAIFALLLTLFTFALNASTISVLEKELTYNYRAHYNFETNQVLNVEDLASRYLDDQYQYLWVAPPDPSMPLYQKGRALALLNYKAFDISFLSGLVAEDNDGMRTYPVWIYENADDSKVVIANKDGKELISFDREKDYSSDWFVYDELLKSVDSRKEQQDWLLACYDPSRIVMRYDLIVGEDDLITYVWQLSNPYNFVEELMLAMPMAMQSSVLEDKLHISNVLQVTNGVQLTVEWGESTLSDDELDFFVCTDIITKNWFIEDTQEVDTTTNVYSWLDYNATNDTSRFYTCWTLHDSDGDGLSDGRETLLYGTSITSPDTDYDYMTDYEEVNAGLDPKDYDDSFADPDGDGYPTLYEVKNGADWNSLTNSPSATYTVETFGSIQSAINQSSNDYDIIKINASLLHIISIDGMINFNGKKILVISEDNSVIDTQGNFGFVFDHNETRESILSGVTIKNAFGSPEYGGAVFCSNASPTVLNCIIKDNGKPTSSMQKTVALYGGGIACVGNGSPLFKNLDVFDNIASRYGAGMYINITNGSPEIVDCRVYNNGYTVIPYGIPITCRYGGGGIFLFNGIIQDCIVSNNIAEQRGAGTYLGDNIISPSYLVGEGHIKSSCICSNQLNGYYRSSGAGAGIFSTGDLYVEDCSISQNVVDGGLFGYGSGIYSFGNTSIINSSVVSNSTDNLGAGIYAVSNLYMENCEISLNSTDSNGGGVYGCTDIIIVDSSIVSNNALSGGGIYLSSGESFVSNSLINCNLATSTGSGICSAGNLEVVGCNIISNSSSVKGGGIYTTGTLAVGDSDVSCNTAKSGAGIFSQGSDVTVDDALICFNVGTNASCGIGIYVEDADFTMKSSRVANNSCETDDYIKGGGIFLKNVCVQITSSSIESNSAVSTCSQSYGGGVYIEDLQSDEMGMMMLGDGDSDNYIVYTSISGNTSDTGGGIYITNSVGSLDLVNVSITGNNDESAGIYLADSANISMLNTICWNEDSPTEIYNDNSSITGNYCCVRGGFPGELIISDDPCFDDGYHIPTNSPCWNTGVGNAFSVFDVDGESVPFDSSFDIGADEYVDIDGDGIPDWWEKKYFGGTLTANEYTDSDSDGLSDLNEYLNHSNPFDNQDSDGDGLSDDLETWIGTDSYDSDSDGDGLTDGWEYENDDYDPNLPDDSSGDGDEDGWSDAEEALNGTDPDDADTDNDGIEDSVDADPLDPENDEVANDSNTREITLVVGDRSGSHSERYKIVVGDYSVYMSHVSGSEYVFEHTFRISADKYYTGYLESLSDDDPDGDYDADVTGEGIIVYDGDIEVPSNRVLGGHHENSGFNSGTKCFTVYVMPVTTDEDTTDKTNQNPTEALTKEPINTINGDVTASDTDLAVQCQGLSLLMKRYYNSRSEYTNSPVGARWNHSFDWQLEERTNYYFRGIQADWLVLRTGNGQQKWFEHITNEYYKAPTGLDWRLIRNTGDTYEMATDGGRASYSFGQNGLLSSASNSFNDSLSFSYDNDNKLSRVEHSNGQFFNYQYTNNLISRINTSTNTLYATYAYSLAGDLTNATRHVDGREYVISYKYGVLHSLTNRCNALGQNFSYEYMITNNAAGIAIAKGIGMSVENYWYEHSLEYNTASNYTTVNYPLRGTNQIFKYKYSPDTFVITDIYGPGKESNVTEYIRDGQNDLVKVKTTDGETGDDFISIMSYDLNHNLTSTGVGFNAEPIYTWNYIWNLTNNTLIAAMDPEDKEVTFEYDGILPTKSHKWLSDTEALTTIFEHNSKGLLTKAINENGHYIEFAYNNYGFATSAVPQIGPSAFSKVNDFGFVKEISQPWTNDTFRTTKFYSDLIGNTTNIVYADGTSESYTFDNMNNLSNFTGTDGVRNEYLYAPTHKLTAVIRSTGSIAATNYFAITNSFEYDQQFNSLFLTDALDRPVESYVMDIKDRPVTVTNVEGQVMNIKYGVGSMIKSVERFDGTIVSNSYNSSARLTQTTVGDLTNSFSYYKNSLTAKVETENGYVTSIYDNANRFVSSKSVADNLETSTDYMLDYGGNATNATIYLNSTNIIETSAEFDAAERLTNFVSVISTDDQRVTNNFAYAYSEITGLTSQVTNETSGIFVEYDFDIMDQLKSIVWKDASNSVIRSFDYSYSISGMITNIAREASAEDVSYEYSDLYGRLWKSSSSYYSAMYRRDKVGNPFEFIINGSYVYGFSYGAGNRLMSWSRGYCSYNDAGCVTNMYSYDKGAILGISWNDRYQMTDVSINGTPAKSYTYDSLGRRSSTTDSSDNVTKIIYDGMHMVADVDEDGDILRTYTAGSGVDNWLSFTDLQTSNTYYYITDHVGTVHAVTDSSGTVVESYRYSPYGKVLAIFDENGNTISKTKIGNRILFQGREYDWDTGFYYFRARWYDPDTGRWLSKDPIGISGGLNQYVFCGNNPVMLVDPDGECAWVVAGILIGAAIDGGIDAVSQIRSGEQFNWKRFGGAVARGAIVGGVSSLAGPVAGSLVKSAGGIATGLAAKTVAVGISATGGAGGQVAFNAIAGEELSDGVLQTAAFSGGGQLASYVVPFKGLSSLKQAKSFAPKYMKSMIRTANSRKISSSYFISSLTGSLGDALYDDLLDNQGTPIQQEYSNAK